jgi:dolichol-phosphate mannosyltransferase
MALISVVSPVYNAEDCLQELYRRLVYNISLITSDFEIILIEDGGDDNSWAVIKEISQNDPRVKGIKFTRNFGVHHAITAGLDISKGDWTIVIECDLQSPPERIKDLYYKALEGYEVVIARFTRRNDNIFRRYFSRVYWRFMSYLSGMNLDPQHGIYRIMSKPIVNNFRLFTESDRHLKAIIAWIGGDYAVVDMVRDKRFSGRSAFTPSKLFRASLIYLVAYSSKPLIIFTAFGLICSIGAFAVGLIVIVSTLVYGIDVSGWASIMLSIYFIGGLIITNLGLIGYYVGKSFDETKKRPIYLIGEQVNID